MNTSPMKKTSIKDIDGDQVEVHGNSSWAGFAIKANRGDLEFRFEFQNDQGPKFALAVMEACGYGNSNAARVLHTLIETIDTHPDYEAEPDLVVDAVVLEDPLEAAKKALAALEAAGATGQPANHIEPQGLEHSVDSLRRYIEAAEAAADRLALEADAEQLHDAWRKSAPSKTFTTYRALSAGLQDSWIAVAQAARAMRTIMGDSK